MERYVFNPEYIISNNDDTDIVFTPDMEKVYILREVESIIVKSFATAHTIDEAMDEIKKHFVPESFRSSECLEFIKEIIKYNILVHDSN